MYCGLDIAKGKSQVCILDKNSPKTPSELHELSGIALSHVSKQLRELSKMGLIECLTPNLRRGKLFALTELGNEAKVYLKCNKVNDHL